jgi:ankyrin repeat protein
MQARSLPARPNLDHLKNEAKALHKTLRATNPDAKLTDAQRQLAREYGFPTWAKLRDSVRSWMHDRDPSIVNRVLSAFQQQDLDGAMEILKAHPGALSNLHVAAAMTNLAFVKEVLASQPELANEKAGDPPASALLYACFTPRLKDAGWHILQETIVRALLEAGADPNATDGRYGVSALYGVTGMHNAPGIARLLLEAGANPTDGESVFHAAEHYHVEALELLREFGVQLNQVGEWGNTPLYFLLRWHDLATDEKAALGVDWLLANGADPNVASGKEQENSLHVAARRGQPIGVIEKLLAHEANVDLRRGDGATAWRLAKRNGYDEIAQLLESAGATPEPFSVADELLAACGRGDVDAARRLSAPAIVSSLPRSDRAMLGEGAAAGRVRTVEACIAAGFDVNEVNDRAATPLHEAAINGFHEIVSALIAAGSDLTMRDPEHNATPLGWAIFGADYVGNRGGDYEKTIRALIGAGAKGTETEAEPRHPGARRALGLQPL